MNKTYIILLSSFIACTNMGMEKAHQPLSLFDCAAKSIAKQIDDAVGANAERLERCGELTEENMQQDENDALAAINNLPSNMKNAVIKAYRGLYDHQDLAQKVYRQMQRDSRNVEINDWEGLCHHVRNDGAWKNIHNYIKLLDLPEHRVGAVLEAYFRLHRWEYMFKSSGIECYNLSPDGKKFAFATKYGSYTDLTVVTQGEGDWDWCGQSGKNMSSDHLKDSNPESIYWSAEGTLYTIHWSGANKWALQWNEHEDKSFGYGHVEKKYTPEDWEAFYKEHGITPAVNHQSLTGDVTIEKVDDDTINASSVVLSRAAMDKHLELQFSYRISEWHRAGRNNRAAGNNGE